MKLVFDRALWPAPESNSSMSECEFNYAADDIDSEISRVLSWVEIELKTAVVGYNVLKRLAEGSNN